jgi:hypothetical protein
MKKLIEVLEKENVVTKEQNEDLSAQGHQLEGLR